MGGKTHPDDVKQEIVALLAKGFTPAQISRDYDIPESTIKHFPIELARKQRKNADYEAAKASLGKPQAPAEVRHTKPAPSVEPGSHIVLHIPDMHHPFAHQDALPFLVAVRRKFGTTLTVCAGDEIDACAFSKYPKDPDGLAPGLEITRAREALIPFYLEFPEMLICESNHTVRPWKMAFQSGLPASFLPTYAAFLNAPDGWKWAHKHEVDGVVYIHGEGRSGMNAHIQFMRGYKKSVVIGHIHSYAAVSHEGHLFAVNGGCLIDTGAYCFKYAKNMPIPVNLGCSVIFHGRRAKFIPMNLDAEGRWNGEI